MLSLSDLKGQWLAVLDDLETSHRTAWLAMFDGRLAALDGDVLTLDFSDATKMAGTLLVHLGKTYDVFI
mgnify:CR=1 FL=1